MQYAYKVIYTLQSLTGKYRGLQGNPCNENRDPVMITGVPCNENRFFPVKKTYRDFPVSLTGFGFAVYSSKGKIVYVVGKPCNIYRLWENPILIIE